MLKTILFDLDGTLLDTEPDFTFILNQLLRQHNRQTITAAQVRNDVSNGAKALIALGFGIDDGSPDFPALLDSLLALYAEKIPATDGSLFTGIIPLLERITSENCQWGIVTNKPERFTLPLLGQFPVLRSCTTVVCPEHISRTKPDPEGLLLACSHTSCKPGEAVYIGDHPRDMEAGNNANMPTIAVDWGYCSEGQPISQWNAAKVVSSADEIQRYLFD